MKQKVKELIKHPLIFGSSIVIVGNIIANFFNFLFNLFMSRNLSVDNYGVFASVMALISFPNLAAGAIVPLVVHFAGNYFATGQLSMIKGLYVKIFKFLLTISIIICLIFLLFIPQLTSFFHITSSWILFITDGIIFLIFLGIINNALLQAKLAFTFQVFINILNAILKLLLGTFLVVAGFSVSGAVGAVLLTAIICYFVSFYPIRFIFEKNTISPKIDSKDLFAYGIPSALTLIGLTSFISADIMLVKHFFNSTDAGLYAGLSLIGRVIFYIAAPIGTVMFPLIVQKYTRKENFTNTFKFSLFLVFSSSITLSFFYYLFPDFTVYFFLKNKAYLAISPLLWFYGIYMALYSVLNIIVNFYLSIKKTNVYLPVLFCSLTQIIGIFFFHQSFMQVILISFIITFLLVLGLLLYYPYATKR